jgi:hypothetical protein
MPNSLGIYHVFALLSGSPTYLKAPLSSIGILLQGLCHPLIFEHQTKFANSIHLNVEMSSLFLGITSVLLHLYAPNIVYPGSIPIWMARMLANMTVSLNYYPPSWMILCLVL